MSVLGLYLQQLLADRLTVICCQGSVYSCLSHLSHGIFHYNVFLQWVCPYFRFYWRCSCFELHLSTDPAELQPSFVSLQRDCRLAPRGAILTWKFLPLTIRRFCPVERVAWKGQFTPPPHLCLQAKMITRSEIHCLKAATLASEEHAGVVIQQWFWEIIKWLLTGSISGQIGLIIVLVELSDGF